MSERYWITGVQLGCLEALQNQSARKDLIDYNVFGSPTQKIGDFTQQSKLARWSK